MASIGSESPPRKKLKQARLPFQVISSPRTDGEQAQGLKRKLSESDDIQITKVVKSGNVEEIKENTVQEDLKTGMKAMLSTLLTSKIINNCTEVTDEDNIAKEKSVIKEEISLKTSVASEVQIVDGNDSNQKSVLSKTALDKLSLWKMSPGSTTSESEPVTKEDIVECTEERTSKSSIKIGTPNKTLTEESGDCEIASKLQCETDSVSPVQTSKLSDIEVESSCSEEKLSKSAAVLEKPDDQDQTLNISANSAVVDINLEEEGSEIDQKDGDLNESLSTASPKTLPRSATASPRTPKGMGTQSKVGLTPKQLARMKEAARKQEEKDKIKLEKERKKQEEQEEKQRLKQEKEEQKRKEKEEKEEQKRKEKEEKEKKRQAEIELKNEEKRRKEEQKAEEKRKKEDEKRKAEEEEERKKAKVSAMFTSFFVAKSSKPVEKESPTPSQTGQNFMPFEVKSDMRVAPCTRDHLDSGRLEILDEILRTGKEYPLSDLYLEQLRRGVVKARRSGRTWLREETKEEDISILEEPDSEVVFVEQPKLKRMRAKFLQFHENHRPAYYGTWRKKSENVSGRRPTAQDKIVDYAVDSADEWEEEEPGESLHGSDDEKDKESEDEYEVDNSVFVPHGYLSDDEGDAEIDEETLNPEMQKAKLKILGEEFETQMKTKTRVLKPLVILMTAAMQSAKLPGSSRYQKLADRRAVWKEDDGPIDLCRRFENFDNFGASPSSQRCDIDGVTQSGSRGAKPKEITDEAIPAFITLIHGSNIKGSFLVSEFYEFLKRQSEISEETPSTEASSSHEKQWPKLPRASKASIARKLKELAAYEQCNEDGPMKGKRCWVVPSEKREEYGVGDLKLPNRWKFILKRPRFEKTSVAEASPSSELPSPRPNDTPTTSAKKCLITNFTKVMTAEEKQLHWEKMKKSSPVKKNVAAKPSGKITSFTSLFPASAPPSPVSSVAQKTAPQTPAPVKKRVALLVSVPRGQDISSAVEAARTSNASTPSGSAVQADSSKTEEPASSKCEEKTPDIIELD